jgi:hypothetical protein
MRLLSNETKNVINCIDEEEDDDDDDNNNNNYNKEANNP